MAALFRNPTFVKLFLAAFASQLGTVVGNMAFAFYLLDRYSNRPDLASMAELMYAVPTLAVFWLVGVLADRLDRKLIAAYSDWIRAGLSALLLLIVHQDWLVAAFAVLFLRSAIAKFFGPAEMGLLQGSLLPGQYVHAAGLNQMLMGVFMLFGVSLGAAAYHLVGIEGAIMIDGISFLLSGVLISLCRFPQEVRLPNGKAQIRDLRLRLIFADFRQGFQYITKRKLLLNLISGFLVFGVINGVFAVLPIFTMKYKLSPDNYELHSSFITIFLGIGVLLGSLAGPMLIKKFSKTTVLIAGLLLNSILIIVLGSVNHIWIFFPIVFITGIILAPVNIVLGGWLPELVEPQSMGRVNAWIEPIMMVGYSAALGMITIAFPAWISITWLYYLLGLCIIVVSVYYWLTLPALTTNAALDQSQTVQAEQ